jgi:hypothetical protein
MRNIIRKLLVFIALFLVFDKLFIIIAHLSAESEIDKRLELVLQGKMNKDILIIGSSRGARDILADQIEEETGLSAYNLCYPGSNVEFHEFILRAILKYNKPPKSALLFVDDDTYFYEDKTESIIFRKDRLYPLVKYSYIRSELIKLGEKDKFLSQFLVLHQLNKANFDIRKKHFTPFDTIVNHGSMPITWRTPGADRHLVISERTYSKTGEMPEKLNAFKEIIDKCRSYEIDLVIVFPPLNRPHSASFESRIRELAGNNAQIYLYNSDNPIYKNVNFYHDGGHLLLSGARIFTSEISHFISSYLNRKNT